MQINPNIYSHRDREDPTRSPNSPSTPTLHPHPPPSPSTLHCDYLNGWNSNKQTNKKQKQNQKKPTKNKTKQNKTKNKKQKKKTGHTRKILTKMVNLRDIAGTRKNIHILMSIACLERDCSRSSAIHKVNCAPLALCIRLRRWCSCPSFPLVDDLPPKAEEHPLPWFY